MSVDCLNLNLTEFGLEIMNMLTWDFNESIYPTLSEVVSFWSYMFYKIQN